MDGETCFDTIPMSTDPRVKLTSEDLSSHSAACPKLPPDECQDDQPDPPEVSRMLAFQQENPQHLEHIHCTQNLTLMSRCLSLLRSLCVEIWLWKSLQKSVTVALTISSARYPHFKSKVITFNLYYFDYLHSAKFHHS